MKTSSMCFLRLQHGCGHYDGPWQPLAHLRRQFHFQLPGQVLPLELCILSNIGRDHPLYLLSLEQQAESEVIHSESTKGTNTEVTLPTYRNLFLPWVSVMCRETILTATRAAKYI